MRTKLLEPLADHVFEQTLGNPFHTIQYTQHLYDTHNLLYDPTHGWIGDKNLLARQQPASLSLSLASRSHYLLTTAQIVRRRLESLSHRTLVALQLASCLGTTVDATVVDYTIDVLLEDVVEDWDTLSCMQEAVDRGILVQKQKACRTTLYSFTHDSFREVAYGMLQKETTRVHLGVARLLHNKLAHSVDEDDPQYETKMFESVESWYIFLLANQWNKAHALMSQFSERADLALVNLRAAQRSLCQSNLHATLHYCKTGLKLLTAGHGKNNKDGLVEEYQYKTWLELSTLRAHAEYSVGNYAKCLRGVAKTLADTRQEIAHIVPLYQIRVDALAGLYRFHEAVDCGLQSLRLLGIHQPTDHPRTNTMTKTGIREESLLKLPVMRDPTKLLAMKILNTLNKACYLVQREEFTWIVLQQVQLTKQHGFAVGSNYAILCYAFLLAYTGEWQDGCNAAEIALRVARTRARSKVHLARNTMLFRNGLSHLRRQHHHKSLHENLSPLLKAYHTGLALGDEVHAAQCFNVYVATSFFCGQPLLHLQHEIAQFLGNNPQHKDVDNGMRFGHETSILAEIGVYQRAIEALTTPHNNKRWTPQSMARAESREEENETVLDSLVLVKVYLSILFGRLERAAQLYQELESRTSLLEGCLHYLPVALQCKATLALSIWAKTKNRKYMRITRKVVARLESMPAANCQHRVLMLRAERTLVSGASIVETLQAYEAAVNATAKSNYVGDAALTAERLAGYLERTGDTIGYHQYVGKASMLYGKWGALAKCTAMKTQHVPRRQDTQSTLQDSFHTLSSSGVQESFRSNTNTNTTNNKKKKVTVSPAPSRQGLAESFNAMHVQGFGTPLSCSKMSLMESFHTPSTSTTTMQESYHTPNASNMTLIKDRNNNNNNNAHSQMEFVIPKEESFEHMIATTRSSHSRRRRRCSAKNQLSSKSLMTLDRHHFNDDDDDYHHQSPHKGNRRSKSAHVRAPAIGIFVQEHDDNNNNNNNSNDRSYLSDDGQTVDTIVTNDCVVNSIR